MKYGTMQVLKMSDNGKTYLVIKSLDPNEFNPYRIYRKGFRWDERGCLREQKLLCDKYADMVSCLAYIADHIG